MFELLKTIRNRITYNNIFAERIESCISLNTSLINEIENLKLMVSRKNYYWR